VRIAAPLQLRGAPLGYLALIAARSQPITTFEVEGIDVLAQQICAALELARLRRSVQRLTTIDTMTGLRNREFLFERLAAEIARAKRYKQPLSLVIVDFDDLRRFNSRHGNLEGNRLLRTSANLVKMSVRDGVDVVCRYSGGEFALLLPNTLASAKGAGAVAERIRRMIETMQFRDENDHKLSHVTASLGIAGLPTHAEDADELLELAVEAVKGAKAAGKNRVGLYNAPR
jgi:diguanylate cyclase (GGDEF)-like protein